MKISFLVFRMRASSLSSFSSPWPDPDSHVLSKIDFGVPLVELFKWLDVRDTLLGENGCQQDVFTAMAMAADCKHPNAVWLTSVCKDVEEADDVRKALLRLGNDGRALCLAWRLTYNANDDISLLRRAVDLGDAFASAVFALADSVIFDVLEIFRLSRYSAAQLERDGFYSAGLCLRSGFECEKDVRLGKENLLVAAELGSAAAANEYGLSLDDSDPARWIWLGRAASREHSSDFLRLFSSPVEQFLIGSGNATVVFSIGSILKVHVDTERRQIFHVSYKFKSWIGPAMQAIFFYESQVKAARLAVDTWTIIATRHGIVKDMRILIGKMIWEARCEANYRI